MPPEPDPATAYLAEVHRELDASAAWGSFGAEDFDWQRHVPRLLAAVEAALEIHHDLGGRCARCFGAYGLRESWPCAEYRAISGELLTKEGSDGRD